VKHNQQEHIANEKKVMEVLRHPFIVRMYQSMRDHNFLYLLLEPSLGGELFSVLREKVKFTEPTARFYAGAVLLAFEYMHDMDIVYRDLKPENLLLDNRGYLKITDFGFAKVIKNRTWTFCGTPDYLAPEIISSTGHGKGVDWWTLGILIFEMLAGFPPFYDDTSVNKIYQKILTGKITFPNHFSEEAKSLVDSLLQLKPTKRIGISAGGANMAKEHPWFAGFDWVSFLAQNIPAPHVKPVKDKYDISNFDDYPDEDAYEEYNPMNAEDPTWDECF
jgi:serine/threonine protein kinase